MNSKELWAYWRWWRNARHVRRIYCSSLSKFSRRDIRSVHTPDIKVAVRELCYTKRRNRPGALLLSLTYLIFILRLAFSFHALLCALFHCFRLPPHYPIVPLVTRFRRSHSQGHEAVGISSAQQHRLRASKSCGRIVPVFQRHFSLGLDRTLV